MSTWQISESGTEVALDDQGRGEVTFVVTNTADIQDRSVLTITALDGAGESWFAVEQPQRLVPPKETAAYVCKVIVPTGTAAGTYALQAVAYSADRDPGETSTTSRRVTFTVAAPPPPPPPTAKWPYILAAVLIALVLAVVAFLLLRDDGFGNEEPPVITGTPEVLQVLESSNGVWSEDESELTVEFQWQRCDDAGEACEAIEGAVLPTYQVSAEDEGSTLRVAATAAFGEDSSTASSEPTAVVTAPPPEDVTVPNVVGQPLSDAIAALQAVGLVVETLTAGDVANDCNPPVQDQSPDAGTILTTGEQVTISSRPPGGLLILCFDFRFPVLIDELPVFEMEELPDLGEGG
jgi:hypothetical protein